MFVKALQLPISSNKKFDIIDITQEIENLINEVKISNGIVNVFSKHSTSAILINENEEGLLKDFENILNELIKKNNTYFHDKMDNNARSHLKSFLLSSSENIPILNSKLDLGHWQSVFFIDSDGPRSNREINLSFIGE
jgi:secondary thiamine-phosphate synthase enzyme